MPELGKAIVFFAAFCGIMGWAVIELLIRMVGAVWCLLVG